MLVLTLPEDTSSRTFIADMFAPIDYQLQVGSPFSVIIDSSQVSRVTLKQTMEVVAWMRANRGRLAQCLTRSSIVVVNTLVETALNTVFKLQKPVAPMLVVRDITSAHGFIWGHEEI